jgi:hypothetical protein
MVVNPCRPFILPPTNNHFPPDCAKANECIAGAPGMFTCSTSIENGGFSAKEIDVAAIITAAMTVVKILINDFNFIDCLI